MSKHNSHGRSEISILEGRVLQWLDRIEYKRLLLATSQGEVVVKLSKDLRHYLVTLSDRQQLLGTWLQVAGYHCNHEEYKAENIRFYDISSNSFHHSISNSSKATALRVERGATTPSENIQTILDQTILDQSILDQSVSGYKSFGKLTEEDSKPQLPKSATPACILVCGKSSCQRRGAGAVIASLQETISDRGLTPQVKVKTTGCIKKCKQGVNLVFMPSKTTYTQVKPVQVSSLITKHFPSIEVKR